MIGANQARLAAELHEAVPGTAVSPACSEMGLTPKLRKFLRTQAGTPFLAIDLDVVWDTAKKDVPVLRKKIAVILKGSSH